MQHEDGTLGVCPVDSVKNAFHKSMKVEVTGLTGKWTKKDGIVNCCSEDGYSASIADKIPSQCCIKAKCKYNGNPTRFGLALEIDEDFDRTIVRQRIFPGEPDRCRELMVITYQCGEVFENSRSVLKVINKSDTYIFAGL